MEFQTNLKLLSNETAFNDFSIRIPKSFFKESDDEFSSFKNSLENQPNAVFNTTVLGAYVDSLGSMMVISRIDDDSLYDKLDDEFDQVLATTFGGNAPIRAQFSINGVSIVHFQLYTDQLVNIKIFILNSFAIQLDFIVPRAYYNEYRRKIESSISTFNARK